MRIACRCFLACHLSCNQLISSSQKGFIKPENIYLSYTGFHGKKIHLNSHINPFVWNLKSQNTRLYVLCGFLSQHVCHPCYVCRGYYLPHLFPDPHPKAPPPPVSLRAGWHPVSYSSGSAAPDGELSGTNEWKTPASPQVPLLLSQLFVAAYVQQTKPSKHDGNKAGNGRQL